MKGLFRRRNLPHWDVLGHPVFITGCLQGSISQSGIYFILHSAGLPARIVGDLAAIV